VLQGPFSLNDTFFMISKLFYKPDILTLILIQTLKYSPHSRGLFKSIFLYFYVN